MSEDKKPEPAPVPARRSSEDRGKPALERGNPSPIRRKPTPPSSSTNGMVVEKPPIPRAPSTSSSSSARRRRSSSSKRKTGRRSSHSSSNHSTGSRSSNRFKPMKLPLSLQKAPPTGAIDFSPFILDKTRSFVGRRELYQAVQTWRKTGLLRGTPLSANVLLVTGDPGLGKSAWLSGLVSFMEHANSVAAYHFCRYDDPITLAPRRWLSNIGYRLLARAHEAGIGDLIKPGASDKLALAVEDGSKRIPDAFVELLRSFPTNPPKDLVPEPWFIAVDSLDEAHDAGGKGGKEIISALAAAVSVLPPWLKVIATSRKDETVLKRLLPPLRAVSIEASSKENMADVRAYVNAHLGPSQRSLADKVVDASGGNFLYVRQVLDAAEGSKELLEELLTDGQLPMGLMALYSARARRFWTSSKDYERVMPLLAVLVAAAGPLPRTMFNVACRRAGLGQSVDIDAVLTKLSSVLEIGEEGDRTVRIYHKSFADWLVEEGWQENNMMANVLVDVELGHSGLAAAGLDFWKSGNAYAVRHTFAHSVHATDYRVRDRVLSEMAMNWDWMRAKDALDGTTEVAKTLQSLSGSPNLVGRVIGQMRHVGLDGAGDVLLTYLMDMNHDLDAGALADQIRKFRPIVPVRGKTVNKMLAGRLQGHMEAVTALAAPPVGSGISRVCTASLDRTVRVWDVDDSVCERIMRGHTNRIRGMCMFPDGIHLATASSDSTIRIWNTSTGEHLATLTAHDTTVTSVATLSDTKLVSGSEVGWFGTSELIVWSRVPPASADSAVVAIVKAGTKAGTTNAKDGAPPTPAPPSSSADANNTEVSEEKRIWSSWRPMFKVPVEGSGVVRTIASRFMADHVVTANWANCAQIWDVSKAPGKVAHTFNGHTDIVDAVLEYSTGEFLTGSHDAKIRIYNNGWQQKKVINKPDRLLTGHTRSVRGLAELSGKRVASVSWDHTGRVWDLDSGESLTVLRGHTWDMNVCLHLGGDILVTGAGDYMALVWNLTKVYPDEDKGLPGHSNTVKAVVYVDEDRMATGSFDEQIRIWRGDRVESILTGHSDRVYCLCSLPPDSKGRSRFASGSNDSTIRVWTEYSLVEGAVVDGPKIVSQAQKGESEVKDKRWLTSAILRGHTSFVQWVTLLPDSQTLVSGSMDSNIRVWNLNGQPKENGFHASVRVLTEHTSGIWAIAALGDDRIASSSSDATIRVWDAASGKLQRVLESTPGEDILTLISLGDGRHVATGGNDLEVRVWDLQGVDSESALLHKMTGHVEGVQSLVNLGNGYIASGSADKTLRVWNWRTGEQVRQVYVEEWVLGMDFMPSAKCPRLSVVGQGPRVMELEWFEEALYQ